MKFLDEVPADIADFRADPLLFEQELDVRPSIAESLERALGFRAGRRYWRSTTGNLYAIDLADLGRGRPSMAIVSAFWPRFEPRPRTDEQIDVDLAEMCMWIASVCDDLDVSDMEQVLQLAWDARAGGSQYLLPI
jgi:hypothetical protein